LLDREPVKAKVKIEGNLAFVETELGERAVIPVHSLCSLLRRFNLIVVEGDTVECPEAIEVGGRGLHELVVEDSGESEEEPEE